MEIEEARFRLCRRRKAHSSEVVSTTWDCVNRKCSVHTVVARSRGQAMFDHLTKCPVATEHGKRYGESEVPLAVKALLKKIGSFIHQP